MNEDLEQAISEQTKVTLGLAGALLLSVFSGGWWVSYVEARFTTQERQSEEFKQSQQDVLNELKTLNANVSKLQGAIEHRRDRSR